MKHWRYPGRGDVERVSPGFRFYMMTGRDAKPSEPSQYWRVKVTVATWHSAAVRQGWATVRDEVLATWIRRYPRGRGHGRGGRMTPLSRGLRMKVSQST